jgi:hypothetical protein
MVAQGSSAARRWLRMSALGYAAVSHQIFVQTENRADQECHLPNKVQTEDLSSVKHVRKVPWPSLLKILSQRSIKSQAIFGYCISLMILLLSPRYNFK